MSRTKHTPGPWHFGGIITAGPAQMMEGHEENAVFANAALISAAPDMLQALKDIENWLANGKGKHACAGWDCATCNSGHWLGVVQDLIERAESSKAGKLGD